MTVPSPNEITSNVLAVLIQVEGKQIPDTCQVLSIDTWASVNQIPRACIVLRDGGGAAENFSISSGNTFLPGNKIEIAAGYHGSPATIFKGVIVKQGITINQKTGLRLVVEAADAAMKMTLTRTSGVFNKETDSGLFSKLISKNLLTPSVTATTIEHESIVQHDCTDWDLLLARAGLNAFLVTVEDGKVTVAPPDTQQKPVLLLENGVSILDLDLQLDAATQYAQVGD
jgi:phage protein D